jgi:hypothetical protein
MAERGRLALTNPHEVEERIEAYFQSLMRKRYVPTGKVDGQMIYEVEEYMETPAMAGLARALGVTRTTLLFYSQGKGTRDESLIPIIEDATSRIAEWWEKALATREASNGAKFALQVNHGYGRETERGETGDGFQVLLIPPAGGETARAIPRWEPEEDGGDE